MQSGDTAFDGGEKDLREKVPVPLAKASILYQHRD